MSNDTKAILYTDGSSLGNPGPAGAGFVLEAPDQTVIVQRAIPLGEMTVGMTEYRALIAVLEEAHRLGATEASIYLDSELVVRQLNGGYRVKNAALKSLYHEASSLLGRLKSFTITHVPRRQNAEADRLANAALK